MGGGGTFTRWGHWQLIVGMINLLFLIEHIVVQRLGQFISYNKGLCVQQFLNIHADGV